MNHTNLPNDPKIAAKVVEANAVSDSKRLERGAIGWLFGGKDSVPNNVAGVIALCSAVAFFAVLAFASDVQGATVSKKDALAALTSIITLTLGFLFGRASKD